MISRRSAKLLAELYATAFTRPLGMSHGSTSKVVKQEALYDFLFERDFEAWFCNLARRLYSARDLQDFVMQLHTGEATSHPTSEWPPEQSLRLSHDLLTRFALHMLRDCSAHFGAKNPFTQLISSLELDGLSFRDGKLVPSESEANEIAEERGELASLYARLALGNIAIVREHLNLTEEHYLNQKWADSIHHSRQYFEQVLTDIAMAWSKRPGSAPLPKTIRAQPIREYLRDQKLLSIEEFDAFTKLYGLLSAAGAHPGMGEQDQARIFRRLALTMVQFMLLRFTDRTNALAGG